MIFVTSELIECGLVLVAVSLLEVCLQLGDSAEVLHAHRAQEALANLPTAHCHARHAVQSHRLAVCIFEIQKMKIKLDQGKKLYLNITCSTHKL